MKYLTAPYCSYIATANQDWTICWIWVSLIQPPAHVLEYGCTLWRLMISSAPKSGSNYSCKNAFHHHRSVLERWWLWLVPQSCGWPLEYTISQKQLGLYSDLTSPPVLGQGGPGRENYLNNAVLVLYYGVLLLSGMGRDKCRMSPALAQASGPLPFS